MLDKLTNLFWCRYIIR